MGNPRQVAGQVSFHYYQDACIARDQQEREFWLNGERTSFQSYVDKLDNFQLDVECRLPSTFQTWFTVTNLHVWLLTVRFRALPPPYGDNFVQGTCAVQ